MYHELAVPGRPLADGRAGYAAYCVHRDAFRAQMLALAGAGLRGTSLGRARALGDARSFAVTFDDGCETDWTDAAPVLCELGFGATFFVVAGFLGRPGHLAPAHVRALADAGFEIGSHTLWHRPLTALAPREVERELTGSRAALEDVVGGPVVHLSCPHGRWSPAVAAAARAAGYRTVSTSQAGRNAPGTPGARLRRIAVRKDASADRVAAVVARGDGLRQAILRGVALDAGRRLLGARGYAALRERLLRSSGQGDGS